jgi:hypothetical protein
MIEAIREIGVYALKKEGKSIDNPLEILVDNPSNKSTKNIMFIRLRKESENYVYDGIELEEFDKAKLASYLYRKGSARGTDLTPTAMVTKPVNTFRQKILGWFKNYSKSDSESLFFEIGNALSVFSSENSLRNLGEINLWLDSQEQNIIDMTHHVWLLAIVDYIIEHKKNTQ